MRKLILPFLILLSFAASAQFPDAPSPIGTPRRLLKIQGGALADSGYVIPSFADTATANRGFLKGVSGLLIRINDTLFIRSNSANKWNKIGQIDTTYLSNRINAKADTAKLMIVDTAMAANGYEAYIKRTPGQPDTIKFRVPTGSGTDTTYILEYKMGDTNAPAVGDSLLSNDYFKGAKDFISYRNGEFQHRDSTDGVIYRWNDSTMKFSPPFVADERLAIYVMDSTRRKRISLQNYSGGGGGGGSPTTIAYVNSADGGNNGGSGTTRTFSYTASSGSNTILLVGFVGDVIGGADDGSGAGAGVTYNGVAMTFVNKTNSTGTGRWQYLYALQNPASGAHNVVITCLSSHWIIAGVAEYSGVQSIESNTTNNTGASSITTTTTTVANNCWNIVFSGTSGNVQTAGSGSTKRANSSIEYWTFFDSGAAITPAGSYSMTTSLSVGSQIGHCLVVLKPY